VGGDDRNHGGGSGRSLVADGFRARECEAETGEGEETGDGWDFFSGDEMN